MPITEAQICTIDIYDSSGELSLRVSHTVAEDYTLDRYGEQVASLNADEMRALAKAITCLISEPDVT